jgi:hypothetical protein
VWFLPGNSKLPSLFRNAIASCSNISNNIENWSSLITFCNYDCILDSPHNLFITFNPSMAIFFIFNLGSFNNDAINWHKHSRLSSKIFQTGLFSLISYSNILPIIVFDVRRN